MSPAIRVNSTLSATSAFNDGSGVVGLTAVVDVVVIIDVDDVGDVDDVDEDGDWATVGSSTLVVLMFFVVAVAVVFGAGVSGFSVSVDPVL